MYAAQQIAPHPSPSRFASSGPSRQDRTAAAARGVTAHSTRQACLACLLAALACLQLPGPPLRAAENGDPQHSGGAADITESDPAAAAELEAQLIRNTRQLTFEGRRAGEGYFSRDGRLMVFQSEREPGNPFFQIYLMDLQLGDIERISPGTGKTTCAWIHPDQNKILFASTQDDPQAKEKQAEELRRRQSGEQRRYSWDYDEAFDLFVYDRDEETYENITQTKGYDAEGSWSPDGRWIAFTSNRRAYSEPLTGTQREAFQLDPAYLNEIFICRSDGSDVRQLTDVPGYDGGPFFSPDGQRICWRRFAPGGATAEVMTMNIDGSDPRQLTNLKAMSWAPFYHPSGEYLVFTTNLHGFSNFELYLVDAAGARPPVRVTYTAGFDGLPAFAPDGRQLTWTSNRTPNGQSQIFLAEWDHQRAMELLDLEVDSPVRAAEDASQQAATDCSPRDILRHVGYLCRPELQGRLTGTDGERLATAYVAAYMDSLGLQPAGDEGGWFQEFEFTAGVDLGDNNRLAADGQQYRLERDWVPVSFSKVGRVAAAPVVFAGYGIEAPEEEDQPAYDSFVHLDVRDRWILAFRAMPEDIPASRRQHLSRFSSLRYKAMLARDKGARGLILVNGPNAAYRHPLIRLAFDGTLSGASVPVISVTNEVAAKWLADAGRDLKRLQDQLDDGSSQMGFVIDGLELAARVDIRQTTRTGRNVLGVLPAGDQPTPQRILVGAHVDHLGRGPSSSSLARDDERDQIHYGADDNASGVAAMLEVAEFLGSLKARGRLDSRRDILFAAWSGEELGLLGATHFAKTLEADPQDASAGGAAAAHGESSTDTAEARQGSAEATQAVPHSPAAADHQSVPGGTAGGLYPRIAACLNMDMVGRLEKKLILQGVGSSSAWPGEIERRNAPLGLPITLQNDSYLPTDASVFYLRGVPILSAFTGAHSQYHTPRDTPDTLDYEGAARIANLIALIARSLAERNEPPDYVAQTAPRQGQRRAGLRAYLGTIPDYAESELKGVKLSGVAATGPAAKSGVRGGDVVVELAGRKVENIYDYTYAIEALKIGQPVSIVVLREGRRIELTVTPGSRE